MALLDFVRTIEAAKRFRMNDFEFVGFDDLTDVEMPEADKPADLDIYAKLKVKWSGEVPESNRSLNIIIADWVDQNLQQITKVVHEKLKGHFAEHHPNAEHGDDLNQTEHTAVWTDQSEYMPEIDEDNHTMEIELELVLDAEPMEEEAK